MQDSDWDPNALTFPPPEPLPLPTCNPKPLAALERPSTPGTSTLPSLPCPPRKSLLDKWYTLSTHLVPAALPRTTPFVPLPPLPQWSSNKQEFKASVARTVEALVAAKESLWEGRLSHMPPNRKPMWTCVNRYVRQNLHGSGDSKGVTLFLCHANGFTKEIWEPVLERLLAGYEAQAKYTIDEIWSWEAANHGDACILNRDSLGGMYDWRDNSRDILHFLLYYLPSSVTSDVLPVHLPRLSDKEAESRKVDGLDGRTLVSVGHSFGGATLMRAAIEQPRIFKSLFMVDAMIRPRLDEDISTSDAIRKLMTGAVQRRDGWSSREEAYKAFAATPFFQAWDPASLDIYVQSALYDNPDGQVRLKMPGVQEAACFAEEYASHETFELLDRLDTRVETRWLVAGKLPPIESEMRRMAVWRRPANSSHVRILNSGHLIAQEAPSEVAKDLHEFMNSRYGVQKALL
ncbi:alpha/beta-hydrolase [Earliella scabrosa]|nr:alpha/beta-hydrolase [Earliella scabrosa]